jgi:hypothetical protein
MRFARQKKINILTLVLSEKKILNEPNNHNHQNIFLDVPPAKPKANEVYLVRSKNEND